jgi:hypothetical protein
MARHLLEELSGIGSIYSGGELLRTTPYRLSVWSDTDSASAKGSADPVIDGHIDITGIAEAVVLAGPDTLRLVLQDGRGLDFSLLGTDGHIIGRGGLKRGL